MVTRRNLLRAAGEATLVGSLSCGIDNESRPTVESVNWAFDSHGGIFTVTIYGMLSEETRHFTGIYGRIDTGETTIERYSQIGKNQTAYSITFVIEQMESVYEDTIEIEAIRVTDE